VRAHLLFGPQGRQLLTSRNIDFRVYACPSLSANRLEYNEPLISDHSSRVSNMARHELPEFLEVKIYLLFLPLF
jgi:hypothetical protein